MAVINREIVVDNFAGGGGASTGIELAIGRSVDVAINHDPAAIAMHEANHPDTKHYCENVWEVDPREVAGGHPVGLVWLSPDCTHHSKARGGKPREKNIRGLAWVAVRWAATVQPRVMMLENVEEFQDWGPLDKNGKPIKAQKGRTFRSFVNALRRQGYKVEWRVLRACDYGAPTTRKRLFMVARCDGRPIVWPEPTHAERDSVSIRSRRAAPHRPASEIIDWGIECKSIFNRKKPLADNTMRRIFLGLKKFVIDNPDPFIAPAKWDANDHSALVTAFLVQYHSETQKHEARGQTLDKPIMTLDTSNRYGLVTGNLIKFRGTNIGSDMRWPVPTVTAGGNHIGEIRAYMVSYYGASVGQELTKPLGTVTTHDRFGLVLVKGSLYQIIDIGLRMLTPRELYNAQGFPSTYIINPLFNGKPFTQAEQVAKCGNSVVPTLPNVLVRANMPELCVPEYTDRFSWEEMLT